MEVINYILSSIIVVITPLIFVKIILNSEIRKNKLRVFIISIIAIITYVLIYMFLTGIQRSLLNFVMCMFLINQIYKIKIEKSILATIAFIMVLMIPEMIILIILKIFPSLTEYFYNIFAGSLLSNIIILLISVPITFFLRRPLRKIININLDYNKKIIIISVSALISVLILFFDIIANYRIGIKIVLYVIAIITFITILIFLIYGENKNISMRIEHEKLLEFMKTYEIELEKERILKHEHKNELITVKSELIDGEDKNKVIEYIDELLGSEDKFSQERYTNFQYLPPNGLKALFYFKASDAIKKGIDLSVNIAPSVKKSILNNLTIKEFKDLVFLLGVYIDNAIEASELSEEKLLGIEIYNTKSDVTIIISNSYIGKIDEKIIGKIHYSTKGKSRGYGLLLATKLLKNNSIFKTFKEITPNLYTQMIIIKKNAYDIKSIFLFYIIHSYVIIFNTNEEDNMYNIKEILKILYSEFSTNTVDIDIIIVNKINYYKSNFFKENIKLQKLEEKIEYIKYPFIYSALYSSENNLIIFFLNNCKTSSISIIKNKFTIYDLINLLRVLYHEIKHFKQVNIRYNTPLTKTSFIYEIEDILTDYDKKYYRLRHDEFYIEIDANIYAVDKVEEYINNNNICDTRIINHIKQLKNRYNSKLEQYNFQQQFKVFLDCSYENKLYELNKYRIINILYEKNGSFKNLNEIMMNKEFQQLELNFQISIMQILIDSYNDVLTKKLVKR